MAESVVQFLVQKLASLLQQEAPLLAGVLEEAEYMRAELEGMTTFLRVVDAMEERDPELKAWVNQVLDVSYYSDAILDELILHLSHHHGNGFYNSLCRICCLVKNLQSHQQIASEIQSLKSRVADIAEGHQRYRLESKFPQQSSSSDIISNTTNDYGLLGPLPIEAEPVGIDEPKQQLVKWLVEGDSTLKCVSVVGIGGSGKTTLVKRVYDDPEVKKNFQSHLWLIVPESYNLDELLRNIILQLFNEIRQPIPQDMEAMDTIRLKYLIDEFLPKRRYLVVMDDVRSIHAWEAVKHVFSNNNCGSRIMLTTRFADIASASSFETDGYVYNMKALSPEGSWTLFCRKVFQGSSCPSQLDEISQNILNRCEGLPLAIVTIGGVLATKDKNRADEWGLFDCSLGVELEINEKLERIKRLISLSYYDLPYYLKICFLYMCIFPRNQEIEKMRLIRLWIAEGFVQGREGMTVEEVAEGYLYELVNRSLVQMAETEPDGRLRTCHIQDLLREIILVRSREQMIATEVSRPNTACPENVRRLAIHDSMENLQVSKCFDQLCSFFIFGNPCLLSLSTLLPVLSSSKLLKVLDLRSSPLEVIPNEIFDLIHLRYLSMRGTKVRTLPKLIGKLQNLETLDLKDTNVTQVPDEILKLQKLRHLLVYRYVTDEYTSFHGAQGFKVPLEIGSLVSLQKLRFIELEDNKNDTLIVRELGRLTQLRRLGILNLKREDGMALCSSIVKMTGLRSLTVASTDEDEILDLESLSSSTPQFLQRLYLVGCLLKVPDWIHSLHSLVKVFLRWSRLSDDSLNSLQGLPNLVELLLNQAYDGEGLCFKAGGFQRLKKLWLISLKGLRWVRVEEGAMSHLENLNLVNCKLLDELPLGIKHLKYLQFLDLTDMPKKLIEPLQNQDRECGDHSKIAHIPRVSIGNLEDNQWIGGYL